MERSDLDYLANHLADYLLPTKEQQREERRFQAAKDIAAGMWANKEIAFSRHEGLKIIRWAVSESDALLAELDRTKEAE